MMRLFRSYSCCFILMNPSVFYLILSLFISTASAQNIFDDTDCTFCLTGLIQGVGNVAEGIWNLPGMIGDTFEGFVPNPLPLVNPNEDATPTIQSDGSSTPEFSLYVEASAATSQAAVVASQCDSPAKVASLTIPKPLEFSMLIQLTVGIHIGSLRHRHRPNNLDLKLCKYSTKRRHLFGIRTHGRP